MLLDTFSDNVLIIYCFVGDFMQGTNTKTDKQPQRPDRANLRMLRQYQLP